MSENRLKQRFSEQNLNFDKPQNKNIVAKCECPCLAFPITGAILVKDIERCGTVFTK